MPTLEDYYRYHAPPIRAGEFTFHVHLLRPHDPALSLDSMVDTLTWTDEQSTLSGTVTAYRPDPANPITLPVTRNQMMSCSVDWQGQRYVLWTMRTKAPQTQVDTGNVSVDLEDDMALLDATSKDWWFRRDHAHPSGWRADEVAAHVAREFGVGVRVLARGTTRFDLKLKAVSGLSVIQSAYQKEKGKSSKSFVIRLANGQLEVVPLQRTPTLYVLGPHIRTALITQKAGAKAPTTVLRGTGRVGKGRGTRKVTHTEYDIAVVRRYGYALVEKDYGRVSSGADLTARVKREYADGIKLNDTVSIEHEGIPFLHRGDGVFVDMPAEDYVHGRSYVYCTRVTHNVQAGSYIMQADFNATDPFAGLPITRS